MSSIKKAVGPSESSFRLHETVGKLRPFNRCRVVGEKEKDGTSSEKTENNPEKTGEARGDNGVEPKLIETADAEDAPAAEQ